MNARLKMSVVSSKYAGKSASVISSHQSGASVAGRSTAGKQVTNSSVNNSKSLPFNAVTIPSTAGKGRLLGDQEITEEEMEHLADVCRRYDMLQRQEDERIKCVLNLLVGTISLLVYFSLGFC